MTPREVVTEQRAVKADTKLGKITKKHGAVLGKTLRAVRQIDKLQGQYKRAIK
jgi:hypothetical protein